MRISILTALLLTAVPLLAQSPINGFQLDTIANPVAQGRSMVFAPDGRLFYTENSSGNIMVINDPTGTPGAPSLFATVSGFVGPSGNDLGLHGIVLHPAFPLAAGDATNRYVYVCHTTGTAGAPQLVVKRFTENIAALGTALPASETTLFSPIDMGSPGFNFGGRIAFGPDGLLYVGVGDGGSSPALAGGFAQNVDNRLGKVLRYQADGAIPLSNPLTGNPMYARGFRNPRGIAFNTSTGDGFAVDSGNPGVSGPDELNVLQLAGNYGWDTSGTSGNQGNVNYINPAWVLAHTFDPSCVAFYPSGATAFPAIGFRTGAAYLGSESSPGLVMRVVLTGGNERTGVAAWNLVTSVPSAVRDLKFGPDGHLYILSDTVLYRLRYIGNQSSFDPVANAGPDQSVNEGALVTLNGTLSADPDPSDILRFTWRQVGGGVIVSINNPTSANPSFTAPAVSFTQNYTFELIVEDGNGGIDNDFVIVTINNTGSDTGPKKPLLEAPGEGGCSSDGRESLWHAALALLAACVLAWRGAARSRN
ncbi:MAG: PQQ-dependent sugar dehydrogenase [Planctomycetes bacterium]|nr:PQQ-dependent sugar dehydrogenase [Planctomycetota bacterium]MCW8136085.1 PQQ-dependent sugar dehydrogenase [Planctomycetota bacterium]